MAFLRFQDADRLHSTHAQRGRGRWKVGERALCKAQSSQAQRTAGHPCRSFMGKVANQEFDTCQLVIHVERQHEVEPDSHRRKTGSKIFFFLILKSDCKENQEQGLYLLNQEKQHIQVPLPGFGYDY